MRLSTYISIITICSGFFFVTTQLTAQDYHLSNYQNNPVLFNPAKTGSFLGHIRVGGVYREQWGQFISSPFQTGSAHADFSFDFGFSEGDWVSGGIQMYGDRSGDLTYQYFFGSSSLAYHLSLNKKQTSVISIGFQYGGNQRQLDLGNVKFGDELSGSTNSSSDRIFLNNFNEMSQDIGVGIQYSNTNKRGTHIVIGTAVQHLFNPRFGNNRVPVRINTEASILAPITKTLWFTGSMYASVMSEANSLVFLLGLPYKIDKKSPYTFTPRLGMRIGDALIVGLGVDYKEWKFNIGYDVTISSARAYNGGRGALEVGLVRTFIIHKKPEVEPIILCPRI